MEQTSYNYTALTGMEAIQEYCRSIGLAASYAIKASKAGRFLTEVLPVARVLF